MRYTKKIETIVISAALLGILLYGAFLRLYALGNDSYWIDESFTLMQARGIVQHGYPLLDSGFVEWKDFLVPYIIAPSIYFFGFEDAWLLRLPSAFFGIMSIFVGYHLAVLLFSRYAGLMFAFFMATCHWYVAWSQQVRGYTAMIFFVLCFFYFLAAHLKWQEKRYLYYTVFSMMCAILSKKFAVVLIFALLTYLFFDKKYRKLSVIIAGITLCGIFFIQKQSHVFATHDFGYLHYYTSEYLWSYFGIFVILAGIGMYVMLSAKTKDMFLIHIAIICFSVAHVIIFSYFVLVAERRYLLVITPFILLYAAIAIHWFVYKFRHKYILMAGIFGVVVCVAVLTKNGLVLMPQQVYKLEHYTPQPDYKKAYRKIMAKGFTENDHIISANPSLDILYLGRAEYAIPWSLTGREGDTTIRVEKEYYSGARKLYGAGDKTAADKVRALRKTGDVYIVIDDLAKKRINAGYRDAVTNGAKLLCEYGEDDRVFVYYFSSTKK